ncbi:NTP transferase domain-containing protein [Desulfitobacterium hafniense]|uniref:HD/PDEase domain-containing protein n=1 Tax=Desulfitobacterium hafniense (strain Y51) TaxID=138119 RepID=Q24Z78_DESHY|nr:NTP transferase domain-containing protein [Desulfitobacterium hafniense]BAE82664.1 hypothetical protein DSY0875 [Desulfitobacterium hafniense Y51]
MNPQYDQGMYASIQAGVRSLDNTIDAFFLLPVDYVSVRPETICSLLRVYEAGPWAVVYPVYQGQKGHPPLISTKLRNRILEEEPEGGLRALLEKESLNKAEIPVRDQGILLDLDGDMDYQEMIRGILPLFPTRRECLTILREKQLPEAVLAHVRAVSELSVRLAEHLNSRGLRLHLGIVQAASLLHDIAKGEDDHALKGSLFLTGLGYPEVAEIIASHMVLAPEHQNRINETTIVYLADKLVFEDKVVMLAKRQEDLLGRFQEEAARQAVKEKIGQAALIQKKIERVLGFELEKTWKRLFSW